MRDHKKLRAFELADELVLSIYRLTAGFPTQEQYGLTSQLRRLRGIDRIQHRGRFCEKWAGGLHSFFGHGIWIVQRG